MITYGKTVFATFTFSRDRLVSDAWSATGKNFNRFTQSLRRLHHGNIQYLRTIEAHNDGYPHVHAILRFPTVLTITNGRYFEQKMYRRWKHLWISGLSDYQPPRTKYPITYILKYVTKGSNARRLIWKRHSHALTISGNTETLLNALPAGDLVRPVGSPTRKGRPFVPTVLTQSEILCQKHKIKQCTWSREFIKYLLN